jgi:hypothetical protein
MHKGGFSLTETHHSATQVAQTGLNPPPHGRRSYEKPPTHAAEKAKSQKRNRELTGGAESARSQTKKVPFNGLNVNVVIINVHKITSKDPKKNQPPTNVTLFVRPFGPEIIDGLDPLYYRWNSTDHCVEMAIQKHMDADEARKVNKQSDNYPEDPTKFRWVQLKPGSLIALADFKHESVKEDSLSLAKIYDLAPRMRKEKEKNPEDKEKKEIIGQDWGWHWFKVTPEKAKRLTLQALSCVREAFPQEAFFFEDQRYPQTSQSACILNVVPIWDEVIRHQDPAPGHLLAWQLVCDRRQARVWAMTPKEPNDKSVRIPNTSATDKSVWTVKALRGLIMVEQALDGRTQKVVVNFWHQRQAHRVQLFRARQRRVVLRDALPRPPLALHGLLQHQQPRHQERPPEPDL